MKSDVITITNQGSGFEQALLETQKAAEYKGFSAKEALHLQLLTEEMLSMVEIVAGEVKASFWIESSGSQFELHVSTMTMMDQEKRSLLLSVASSRKNEAAGSFLGKLRDIIEEKLTAEPDYNDDLPSEVLDDLANHVIVCKDPEWDGYEHSTLKKLADVIKVSIRGKMVDLTISKKFA